MAGIVLAMLLMLVVAGIVVAADQGSKAIVTSCLPEGTATSRAVFGIRLCHVANRRHPWRSAAAVRLMTLALLLLIVAGTFLGSVLEVPSARVALGAMFGGATGNLIDGITRRGVIDFIDLRVWPVFNLADTAIVTGTALAVWTALSTR